MSHEPTSVTVINPQSRAVDVAPGQRFVCRYQGQRLLTIANPLYLVIVRQGVDNFKVNEMENPAISSRLAEPNMFLR